MNENGIYKYDNITCDICNVLYLSNEFESTVTGKKYHINFKFDCNSINVIYLLMCKTCRKQYFGSTVTKFCLQFRQYKSNECGFTLKCICDIITYSQMQHTDKYSQHSSNIWPVWLNGRVFVCELSGCEFESFCSHLNFRFCACSEQGVPWHSGNYRAWIHSETHTWHNNIQSNALYR